MTQATSDFPLSKLESMGLISARQHRLAQQHPDYEDLLDRPDLDRPDLGWQLSWLVCRGVLAEQQLKAEGARVGLSLHGPAREAHLAMMKRALERIAKVRERTSKGALNALSARRVIDEHELNAAQARCGAADLLATPAAAFAWMVQSGQLHESRVREIWRKVTDDDALASLLTDADGRIGGASTAPLTPAERNRRILRWFWMAEAVVIMALFAWSLKQPVELPQCADAGMRQILETQLLEDAMEKDPLTPSPRIGDIATVGYSIPTGTRGCKAVLTHGAARTPYTYIIAPIFAERGRFSVSASHPEIVAMRFASANPPAQVIQAGRPLGRGYIEHALEDGVQAFTQMGMQAVMDALPRDDLVMLSQIERSMDGSPHLRYLRIVETEPIAPCREMEHARRYRCLVLVAAEDTVARLMGRPASRMLQGEFTFERADMYERWHVTDQFPAEFSRAFLDTHEKARQRTLSASNPD